MGGETIRIAHMASMARSGETLMQRAFIGHPAVHVVHDVHPTNDEHETRLFQLLRVWPRPELPRWQLEQHLAPGRVAAGTQVLLIKQGVFAMRSPFNGFALVRNPYASFCSLWHYDARLAGVKAEQALNERNWRLRRLPRLVAWMDAIEPGMLPALLAEAEPARQFLMLWRVRMQQLVAQCRTVVLYEDFVNDPQPALRSACAAIGVPFDGAMLKAHEKFEPGQIGHGGIDLGAAIHPAPAWRADAQVDITPFRAAVRDGPIAGYRQFYEQAGSINRESVAA
jgi:hypothetical protein